MATRFSIARLSVEISTGSTGTVQLMPAGSFRGIDGRPKECAAWHIDARIAAQVIAQVNSRKTRYVIDYEHQTLAAAKNGQPAPAAGWFSQVEWREGEGLFATDVDWTDKAAAFIDANEYRYISPVFSYDPKTGEVGQLLHAALTNNPAVDGMDEVTLAAATALLVDETTSQGVPPVASLKETSMDIEALLEQLRWLLNMPVGATADDIKTQLQKLIDQLSGGQGTAAASVNLVELLAERDQQIAALSANQVDPAKFVPLSVVDGLRSEIAALSQRLATSHVQAEVATTDSLVTAALSDGRLHPTMESWARELGATNPAALKSYVEKAQPIAALTSQQTATTQAPASRDNGLSDSELAVCRAMGLSPDEFVKTRTATE